MKHQIVQNIATKLPSHPILKPLFIAYLMADTEEERKKIENDFWSAIDKLPAEEREPLTKELKRTFLLLPILAEQVEERVLKIKLDSMN